MRNTKWECNFYSFFDHTGIERHLEKMAAKGWLIEKLGYLWRYRRIEPQDVRFAVVYYPEASEFDPDKPSEGELTFWDFCAQAGWVKAVSRAQMNIFYHKDANAVPIETDAALQVKTLHRSMKKEPLIASFLLLAVAVWMLFDACKSFVTNFAAAISRTTVLIGLLDWALLLALCALELGGYYLWRRRAKRAAERGVFLPTRSYPAIQVLALALVLGGVGIILCSSDSGGRRVYLILLAGYALLNVLIQGIKALLKRRGGSAGVNKGVTIAVTMMLAFVFTYVLLDKVSDGELNRVPENAVPYEVVWSGGETSRYYAYEDSLPLYVQDLTKTDYDQYSCELTKYSSLLAAQTYGKQEMRMGDGEIDAPELSYCITDVKAAPLFNACLQGELDYFKNFTVTFRRTYHPFRNIEFRAVDAAPWGAERAWRAFNTEDGEWGVSWVLTRGTRIVRVSGSALDGTLTDAQKATVGERLLGN